MALFGRVFNATCSVFRSSSIRLYSSVQTEVLQGTNDEATEKKPVLFRNLQFVSKYQAPRQVWVENLDTVEEQMRGLVELHPSVFGTMPRIDLIYQNFLWQRRWRTYKRLHVNNRAECRGGGRKPWPQKGMGKARQGSIRAPQWLRGGAAHGPRNPTSWFYMLPYHLRLHGLTSTLTVKLAQDDFHVVDNIDIPTDNKQFILDLCKHRNWGPSVLIIDDTDIMPRNITVATDTLGYVNMMPVYGLNVYSMLKHETLVLTLAALERLEGALVTHLNNSNDGRFTKKLLVDQQ